MLKCRSCDAGVPANASRCGRCGTPIALAPDVASTIVAAGPTVPPAVERPSATKKGTGTSATSAAPSAASKWPWIIVITLLLVIIVILVRRP
jgi:hypothetical protein